MAFDDDRSRLVRASHWPNIGRHALYLRRLFAANKIQSSRTATVQRAHSG
jgi:hypothetical protein